MDDRPTSVRGRREFPIPFRRPLRRSALWARVVPALPVAEPVAPAPLPTRMLPWHAASSMGVSVGFAPQARVEAPIQPVPRLKTNWKCFRELEELPELPESVEAEADIADLLEPEVAELPETESAIAALPEPELEIADLPELEPEAAELPAAELDTAELSALESEVARGCLSRTWTPRNCRNWNLPRKSRSCPPRNWTLRNCRSRHPKSQELPVAELDTGELPEPAPEVAGLPEAELEFAELPEVEPAIEELPEAARKRRS